MAHQQPVYDFDAVFLQGAGFPIAVIGVALQNFLAANHEVNHEFVAGGLRITATVANAVHDVTIPGLNAQNVAAVNVMPANGHFDVTLTLINPVNLPALLLQIQNQQP